MEDFTNYDSWKLANGQDSDKKIYSTCECCGDSIYHGDEIKVTRYGTIHSRCFNDFVEDILNPMTYYAGE